MIVKDISDVACEPLVEYNGVSKGICLGPDEGSAEIVLRCFSVEPGGSTPYHQHGFPHLVKVERGEGVVVDEEGAERPLRPGSFVYVRDDELHCFKNTGTGPFDFLCIVPERGEK